MEQIKSFLLRLVLATILIPLTAILVTFGIALAIVFVLLFGLFVFTKASYNILFK